MPNFMIKHVKEQGNFFGEIALIFNCKKYIFYFSFKQN